MSGPSDLVLVSEYTANGMKTSTAAAASAFKGSRDWTEVVQGDERHCSLNQGFNIWPPLP